MHDFPKRKNYIYTIPTIKGDFVLKFKQSTANETLEYYEMLEILSKWTLDQKKEIINKLNKYYFNFLKEKSDYKWYNIHKRRLLSLVKKSLASYIDEIVWMFHPIRKSVYIGTQQPKINWKKPRQSIFPNEKEAIYKKTWIPVNKIYDEFTMEQIWRYLDKIVFEVYESFKEWMKINDTLMNRQIWWLTEQQKKDLAFIKSQKH